MHLDLELVHVGEVRNCFSERVAGPLGFTETSPTQLLAVFTQPPTTFPSTIPAGEEHAPSHH